MGAQHVSSAGTLLSPGCIPTLAALWHVHHQKDSLGRPSATMHVCAGAASMPVKVVSLWHPFCMPPRRPARLLVRGSVCWACCACPLGRLMQAVVCAICPVMPLLQHLSRGGSQHPAPCLCLNERDTRSACVVQALCVSGASCRPLSMRTCCRTLPAATAPSLVAAAASFVVVAVVMNVTHLFILIPAQVHWRLGAFPSAAGGPRHTAVCPGGTSSGGCSRQS